MTAADPLSELQARISSRPRLAAVQRRVLQAFIPGAGLEAQQHLKALWYPRQLESIARAQPEAVRPINMELVPSLECNLACPVCTYRQWKTRTVRDRGKRLMSFEDFCLVLDRLEEGGVQGVTVTGGGEPFANPHTLRGLEYAAQKRFKTGVFTNGTLLDEPAAARLAGLPLSFIRISLNTADRHCYRRFHAVQDDRPFEAVLRTIALLGSALRGSSTAFGIAAIINEVNVASMPALAELIRELFEARDGFKLDYLTLRPVMNYGQLDRDLLVQIKPSVARMALENFARIKDILQPYPVELRFAADHFDLAAAAGESAERCIAHGFCGSVAYDANVYLCSERDGDPEYCFGNLTQSSLTELWESPERAAVLSRVGGCPRVCKMQRTNRLLGTVMRAGLDDAERAEFENFLNVLRRSGSPDRLEFFSW